MKTLIVISLFLAGCATDPCKLAANYQEPQHIDKPYQQAAANQHQLAVRECINGK